MLRSWRPLAAAAVFVLTAGSGAAFAQKVLVRNAPAGTPVEVMLNGTAAGTGTTDANGQVTVPVTAGSVIGANGIDANIFLDVCGKTRRVQIVEHTKIVPAPESDCERQEISGLYWVRPVNTLVFDVGGATPNLLLVRGTYVYKAPRAEDTPRVWRPIPRGVFVFAGAGDGRPDLAYSRACGNAENCSGRDSGIGIYTFGADLWISRYLGVEGSYVKPRQITANGGDLAGSFNFKFKQDSDIVLLGATGGFAGGPVRIYGKGGAAYNEITQNTTETAALTTQTFQVKTSGWSYYFGGGGEVWVWPKVALYADLGVIKLKGDAATGGEVKMDDEIRFAFVGVKFHLAVK